jgi:hypothetical protein
MPLQLNERKLICGIEHVVVRCRDCGELFWARRKTVAFCGGCSGESSGTPLQNHVARSDVQRSDLVYEFGLNPFS